MNFRNHSNDELCTFLQNVINVSHFVEAAKELTERVVVGDFYSKDDHDSAMEEAIGKAEAIGEDQMRSCCREEAVALIDSVSSQISKDTYDYLKKGMNVIG